MRTVSSDSPNVATGDTLAANRGLAVAETMTSGAARPGPEDTADGAAPRRAESTEIPLRLGRYHILERLGAGGMGVVYAAYDPDLDRKVAVKLLHLGHGSRDARLRLLREAQALARLSHPNVVQIHDASVVGAQVFLAMEFVRGVDLRTWLSAQVRTDREILRVFLDAGRGLAAAHAEGLVHRDFKPENVLVGDDGRVRVVDFGLARTDLDDDDEPAPAPPRRSPQALLELRLTATDAVLGTPAYMSPEQHTGKRADARSDQYSFCVALWEALYRQRPFTGGSYAEISLATLDGRVTPPPTDTRVPRRIGELLRRGMLPRPQDRHPDMPALLAALERDPARARRRWFAGAALLAMSTGTAFVVADRRAVEASACSGADAELAGAWDPARRDAVAAALAPADPGLSARILSGLDTYAATWAAAHRDACLDHRRGEVSPALFDARVRCLDRRRLALGGATALLAAREPPPDPAQLVARLPSVRACADPERALSEATWPEDPVLASAARALDARLIDARALYHAGDIDGARVAAEAVVDEARRRELRPLLAEALLLLGQVHEALHDPARGREAVAEAAAHALATGRDEIAAEALARRIYFDGDRAEIDDAFAEVPLARALAERLPAPAAALARLDNNLGVVHIMKRDLDGARPHLERATAGLASVPDGDPLEHANYWGNLAAVTREPAAREQAFARADEILTSQLGEQHLLTLEMRLTRGTHAADARAGVAALDGLCPRYAALYPASYVLCGVCYYTLGQYRAALGEPKQASVAFRGVDACLERTPDDRHRADELVALSHRADAFDALLHDQPAAALVHADAARARIEPHLALWWHAAELAEVELARGRALLALDRPEDARAALTRAIPVFEDMLRSRTQTLDAILLAEARRLLAGLPPPP